MMATKGNGERRSTDVDQDPSSQSESFSVDESTKSQDEEKIDERLLQCKLIKEGPIIIMPLDPSNHSFYCLTFYVKYIHKPENKIHVCYVAENYTQTVTEEAKPSSRCEGGCLKCLKRFIGNMTLLESMGPSPGVIKELEQEDKAGFKALRSKVRDVFKANDIRDFDVKRIRGVDPWTAILDYREQKRGTMIVLGSRGLGMVKRSILGSVSERVLRKSAVPVLVVRLPFGALSATTDPVTGGSMIY